jgi:hypothetical protein
MDHEGSGSSTIVLPASRGSRRRSRTRSGSPVVRRAAGLGFGRVYLRIVQRQLVNYCEQHQFRGSAHTPLPAGLWSSAQLGQLEPRGTLGSLAYGHRRGRDRQTLPAVPSPEPTNAAHLCLRAAFVLLADGSAHYTRLSRWAVPAADTPAGYSASGVLAARSVSVMLIVPTSASGLSAGSHASSPTTAPRRRRLAGRRPSAAATSSSPSRRASSMCSTWPAWISWRWRSA